VAEFYKVFPSGHLTGEIAIQGAKNSVLKLMAATVLAPGKHVITNVPDITDVHDMSELLRAMGAGVSLKNSVLEILMPADLDPELPEDFVKKMRASIVLIGPMLARKGYVKSAMPGGDDFGGRPINFHVKGFESMGASVKHDFKQIIARAQPGGLQAARYVLEYPSHTATDNLMMAAVLARGVSIIENAAREPEVVDLAKFLNSMGAKITGAGTSLLKIEGVDQLCPGSPHELIPDRVEAATFMAAVGIAGGSVKLKNANYRNLDTFIYKLQAMGLEIKSNPGAIEVCFEGRIKPVDIVTLPYPGVATDYKPFLVTMLALAEGTSVVTENVFGAGRFRYVDELNKLGAKITLKDHHALIKGVEIFNGGHVKATDVRGGAALVMAGLKARSETIIGDIYHIKRGYERFSEKLRSIGVEIYHLV
jgi:UDP-N-acetylglucosamine 1-carboxyvinyltransferase